MKVVISGYGKMGHMVEASLLGKGLAPALATEDVCSVPDELASESVCIDFTTPEAFRSNYKVLAKKFKAVVVGTTGWYANILPVEAAANSNSFLKSFPIVFATISLSFFCIVPHLPSFVFHQNYILYIA